MPKTLKRQFDKLTYENVAALTARRNFERNERYDAEVKTVNLTTSDLVYNQKNDTTLTHDGLICIVAANDANGQGSKWIRSDAKAVGSFEAVLDVELESGAEYPIENISVKDVFFHKIFQFQRADDVSNFGLENRELPRIIRDETVTVLVRNNTDTTIPIGEKIVFNWCELGNV